VAAIAQAQGNVDLALCVIEHVESILVILHKSLTEEPHDKMKTLMAIVLFQSLLMQEDDVQDP